MTIVVAGGTGFLGRILHHRLAQSGHSIRVLTRRPPTRASDVQWQPDGTSGDWAHSLTDADVIVNLAGEGIADRRWTAARKAVLRTSRILPARSLAAALKSVPPRPRLVIAGSAIGFYGARGDEAVSEETGPGDDFLARLCVEWEREAAAACSETTRVAIVRAGLVLHAKGGALEPMLLPFRLGVGGPLGSGRQYWSWIHADDWAALVAWIAARAAALPPTNASPLEAVTVWNATAPQPVTNAEFARVLGRVLRRPAMLPAPAFALRLVLGEFAQALTTGARVLPARAEREGFSFRFRGLEEALRDLLPPRAA